jgi:predicted PurR-regulated permease PerM
MKIVISEEQYRLLIEENFKNNLISKIESFKNFTTEVLNDLKQSFNFNIKFGLTYGAGIGVLLSHVNEFLSGKYPQFTDSEINMLAMTAIMIVFFETKDVIKNEKLQNKIDDLGLSNELAQTVNHVGSLKKKIEVVLKSLDSSIWRATDIIGYTFLLPILNEMSKYMSSWDSSSIDWDMLSKSISISTGIILTGHILKKMFDKLSK